MENDNLTRTNSVLGDGTERIDSVDRLAASAIEGTNGQARKRKRGRPSNAERAARLAAEGNGGIEGGEAPGSARTAEAPGAGASADPQAHLGGASERKERPKRPAQGTRAQASANATLDVNETAAQIQMYYAIAATATQNAALDIGPAKAMAIAMQMAEVSEYYPVKTKGPVLSVVKLVGILAWVNLPIMVALSQAANARRAARKSAATPSTPEEVIPGVNDRQPYDLSEAPKAI